MGGRNRRAVLAGVAGGVATLSGCVETLVNSSGGRQPTSAWMRTELTDVRSDRPFAITDFVDRPVLLQPFEVDCRPCLAQQEAFRALHESVGDGVVTVSVATRPDRDPAVVRRHANRHGFAWRHAVPPASMIGSLVDQYGSSIVDASRAPVVLVCPNRDTWLLRAGVKPADLLREQTKKGC